MCERSGIDGASHRTRIAASEHGAEDSVPSCLVHSVDVLTRVTRLDGDTCVVAPRERSAEIYFRLRILEATSAKSPRTMPEATPTTGPIISIMSLGESGSGIVFIMAASCGCRAR